MRVLTRKRSPEAITNLLIHSDSAQKLRVVISHGRQGLTVTSPQPPSHGHNHGHLTDSYCQSEILPAVRSLHHHATTVR
eukprot:2920094-Rhodomonas_salina.9